MKYSDIPIGDLVRLRREMTDEIRDLWKQHAKLKRERDAIDAAIEKHQGSVTTNLCGTSAPGDNLDLPQRVRPERGGMAGRADG